MGIFCEVNMMQGYGIRWATRFCVVVSTNREIPKVHIVLVSHNRVPIGNCGCQEGVGLKYTLA